MAVFGNNRVYM